MSTQASSSAQADPDYRCIEVELLYTCGHLDQTLDQMPGDCLCPDDPDPAHHIKDVQTVEVDTVCPACEAGSDETKLRARMEELEGMVHQHMADQAYEEWSAGRNPMVLPWNDVPIHGVEALEKHITYLESLLLCGFSIFDNDAFDLMLHSRRSEGGSTQSGTETERPASEITAIYSPSQAPVASAGQQQQQPATMQTGPAQAEVETSTAQAPRATHPRVMVLRGVSGLRREFIPGVEWRSNWLSRRETNNRRDAWRRGRGV
ncbi:hypothetical protein P7C71_g5453, partial [Lecanoromycetidae sp. Uapishka_2]